MTDISLPACAVLSVFITSYSGVVGDYVPMGWTVTQKDFLLFVCKRNSLLMTPETQLPPLPLLLKLMSYRNL